MRIRFILLPALLLISACGNTGPRNGAAKTDAQVDVVPRTGKKINTDNTIIEPLTLAQSNIAGKVKFISYRRYKLLRWKRKALLAKGYYAYNSAGCLLSHSEYNQDSVRVVACLYNYDDKNRATEWTVMDVNNGRDSKIVFTYSPRGSRTEEVVTDKDPKFSMKATFKYDSAGDEIQEKDFTEDGKLKEIVSCKYDARGNQTDVAHHIAPDLIIHSKFTCIYDANGNEISGAKYSSDTAVISKWTCKNNDSGKCVEKSYFTNDGCLAMKNTFKYDHRGNLLEYNYYRPNGALNEEDSYSMEYIYDKTGNITKLTKFVTRSGKKIAVEYTDYEVTYFN